MVKIDATSEKVKSYMHTLDVKLVLIVHHGKIPVAWQLLFALIIAVNNQLPFC